jgi:hypothetical protein
LVDGGLVSKAHNMSANLWTDDDGEVNGFKFNTFAPTATCLSKLKEDNTIFKKELVTMTMP